MAGQRKLPQWYLDKVNLAVDAFAGAPSGVKLDIPHVEKDGNSGRGVSAQRIGRAPSFHPGIDLAGQSPPPGLTTGNQGKG